MSDTVAIIAPSSSVADADQKLQEAIKLLESKGYKCKYYDGIFSGHKKLPYFASAKENRVAQLKRAISDPEVDIIWAFRGGYGATEIVFDLYNMWCKSPKILIGFSDITALHFLFNQKYQMQSIHGSVITSVLDLQSGMLDKIISVLNGKSVELNLKKLNWSNLNTAIIAPIIGGNLTVLCNLIGTKLHPDTKGKVLFLEDVNEKGYQVHRHLVHMKNAELFQGVAAVIFADFTKSDKYLDDSIEAFCQEHLTEIPVFKTSGIGHSSLNIPITIGGTAIIENDILIVKNNFKQD